MDIWSDWNEIAKAIAVVDWWLLGILATAVATGAIGVWSWPTGRAPRQPRSAQPRPLRADAPLDEERGDVASTDGSHDTFHSAA